jgi:hypothetical protein
MAGKLSQRLLEVMERHGDAGARVKLGAVVGDREDPGRRCGRQGHRERVDDTEQLGARGPRSARSGRSPARRRRRRPRARSCGIPYIHHRELAAPLDELATATPVSD